MIRIHFAANKTAFLPRKFRQPNCSQTPNAMQANVQTRICGKFPRFEPLF
jgi:hypothetical protein